MSPVTLFQNSTLLSSGPITKLANQAATPPLGTLPAIRHALGDTKSRSGKSVSQGFWGHLCSLGIGVGWMELTSLAALWRRMTGGAVDLF
jgi:hypothetical protein